MSGSPAQHQPNDESLRRLDPVRDLPQLQAEAATAHDPVQPSTDDICPICDGAGWLTTAAPVGHPDFAKLIRCECTKAHQAQQQANELVRLSNLAAFHDKTFATFNPFIAGLRDVLPKIVTYARNPQGWLSLLGSYGTGKTHLAAAIAHEVLGRHQPALFTVVPDLLDHLRVTFSPQSTVSYDERFEQFRSVPLLILDDLGTESATVWAREKLYQLLNHRYNWRLATVITSNLVPSALDPRIYSRMCDTACGVVITISAPDYRRRLERPA